ncbi:MAG: sigma-70 family RNA polymerase sigma factor [Clostridia bacterium]|nr:sigma-70 family RNA polymerase sigma factor [Clostridia bacterium]
MTDEAIVAMLFERSEESISAIDKKYGKKCRKMSLDMLGNEQDAEECVNDAYLAVWKTVPPARPEPFAPFLLRLVRNVCLTRIRDNKRHKRRRTYEEAFEEMENILVSEETVERALDAKEFDEIMRDFLLTLNKENRVTFVRRYWFLESCADIAKALGTSEKNITVRLTRIREKLRKYLEERGVEW